MITKYYKIPLGITEILQGRELPTCSIRESIHNALELIIMTKFGEHRYDPGFGCEVWNLDFAMTLSESKWEETLTASLKNSIIEHEDRLSEIELTVEMNDIQKFHAFKHFTEVKKKVDISMRAVIRKTGDSFSFRNSLLLSPLSKD